jgi:hypothetical protein
VFKNQVLRKIPGTKRDKVTAGWIKQHNEELHGSYSSADISQVIDGHVTQMGQKRNA